MPRQRTGCVVRRKDRDGWWARLAFTDANGKKKVVQRKVENKTEGRQLLKKMIREVEQHSTEIITGDKMKFADLARHYQIRKLTPATYQGDIKVSGLRSYKTQQRRLGTLVEHFGKQPLQKITHSDLEAFKLKRLALPTFRKQERSHADVNRDLQLMRIVMNYAKRQGWITQSPFERGESLISTAQERQRDRVLTRDEETRLLLACATPARQHLRSIVIALVDTALRRGELRSLTWSDVDFDAGLIRVRAMIAKTAKARTVPITARLRVELNKLKADAGDPLDGQPFGVFGDFKNAFTAACKAAGIEGLRTHDLRHTATTRMIEAGMPPAQVMVITGHTDFATFRRYVSADDVAVKRAAELLDAYHLNVESEMQTTSAFVN